MNFLVNQPAVKCDPPWRGILRQRIRPNTLIVGIGNRLKSDDGIGPVVAARLKAESNLPAMDCGTTPENFLFKIISLKPDSVLIVDAVDFHGRPGEIRILEAEDLRQTDFSTHAISPRLLASAIQRETRADCFFLAVQPSCTALGEGLSPAVAEAADKITEMLADAASARE